MLVLGAGAIVARAWSPAADTGAGRSAGSARPSQPPGTTAPVRIATRDAALALRRRLRHAIRREPGPAAPRIEYSRGVATSLSRPLPGVVRTDRLVVRQAYGIDSRVELHVPAGRPRGFVLVHGGHAAVEDGTRTVLEALTRARYLVATLNMPLIGDNPRPRVRLARIGTLALTAHDLLALLPERRDALLRLFLDPVRATIGYARQNGFASVAMVGLSGGGWTTTLSAALDPRIARSYAVAGSVPLALRGIAANQGDLEQMGLPLYRLADYQQLYLLGALEPRRRALLIHNDADPCCYRLTAAPPYAGRVAAALRRLGGGAFGLRVVPGAEHEINAAATALILDDLRHFRQ